MRPFVKVLAIAVLIGLLEGCASVKMPVEDREAREAAAGAVFGANDFVFLYLPAKGMLADALKSNVSGLSPGMQASATQTAQILSRGQTVPTRVALTSPRDAVAVALLRDAVSQLEGKQLPLLELAFIGKAEVREEVSALMSKSGARLVFVEH